MVEPKKKFYPTLGIFTSIIMLFKLLNHLEAITIGNHSPFENEMS